MNHFLCLGDVGREGLVSLLDAADRFKASRGRPEQDAPLRGKSIALVFEKSSTRTRVSLEVAVNELGGSPLVISSAGSQIARGEPIEDTARVLSRMVHAITLRTFSHDTIQRLAAACTIPVLNALTDSGHPMQLLADLQTVRREFGEFESLEYAWVGDGNNMANSWIEAAGLLGLTLRLACPKGFQPDPALVDRANARGGRVHVTTDPKEACSGAHVISTDVFASMGQEAEANQRLLSFQGMCVDDAVVAVSDSRSIVLHCLPAHRGEEITESVLEGPRSRVWDQAESRLHTSKAVLCWALGVSQ